MAHSTIDRYITTHYQDWLKYSRRQCYLKRIGDIADEILSDAVLVLLLKSEQAIIGMINELHDGCTRLDLFMRVVIQCKCKKRWQKRHIDRLTVRDIDINRLNVTEPESEDHTGYDICGKMNQLRELLPRLNISKQSKQIFEFIVIQGHDLAECSGSYNAICTRISRVKKVIRQAVSNQ